MPVVEFRSQPYNLGLGFWAFGFCICGFSLSRSGPLLGRFRCHGLVRFWGVLAVTVWSAFGAFSLSRSGPLLGVLAVTVWSAFGAFSLSRSGPLLGVLAVTVWSAFGGF